METNFIPIENYSAVYFNILLAISILTFLHTAIFKMGEKHNILFIKIFGMLTCIFAVLYIGLRPIDPIFGDMVTYNRQFEYYKDGYPIVSLKDVFFHVFMKFCSTIMSADIFFLLASTLYIIPLYIASKKWFGQYWFYSFLLLIGSLSFWGYGVNGVRNGIATSIFLLALSRDRLVYKVILIVIAVAFHKTLLLPTAAYLITLVYKKPKAYLLLWLAAIPLSLFLGGFWESFFGSFIEDDRAAYLLDNSIDSAEGGVRWDFLIYSAIGVFAGGYYIFKRKYNDAFYFSIFNMYLFSNALWILIIKANYTNRFAYLSWFILAVVIIYPLLKQKLLKDQHLKIGVITLLYVGFTYIINVIMASKV